MLYEDEFSLSNTATIGYQWSAKGQQPKVQCKQRKRERATAFGSLNYDTGQITVSFAQKGNSYTFKKHLKKVLYQYKGFSKIIMVLDNVAYHHANRIKDWLAKRPQLELFFLPPYSPDLNAVERAWWYMRKKITHNRFVKSLDERKCRMQIGSYHEIREALLSVGNGVNMRTAAFTVAINKVGVAYEELGIFP